MKRRGGDSNSRYPCGQTGFRNRRVQPLRHLSVGTRILSCSYALVKALDPLLADSRILAEPRFASEIDSGLMFYF